MAPRTISYLMICAAILPSSAGQPQGARGAAAPHTISSKPHPFDPDWLEVKWILDNKCVGCHRPNTDRYDFSSYQALMQAGRKDDLPAIVPGKLDDSLLWEYVAWNVHAKADSDLPDQPVMPPKQHEWLTAGQLETLRRWIEGGALEYKLPPQCDVRPLLEIDYPSAKQCGACHPRQYEQWSRSMHAYAQHSPVFEAFNLTLIERTGGTIGTFCTRCHTPLGTALGENGSRRNVHRSRLSMEGVTCVVCHRRKDRRYKANGRVAIEPGGLLDTCVYGPFDDPVSAEQGAHPAAGQPYLKSSQFCGECHDVTSPTGVRLEEAFSEWQNSPAAKEGVTCQHCHMGPVQGKPTPDHCRPLGPAAVMPGVDPQRLPLRRLSDHTFAGPDYSLLPDTEFPHKLDWMYEKDYRNRSCLTPHQQQTLDDLRRRNRESLRIANLKRYELLKNAAEIRVEHPYRVRWQHRQRVSRRFLGEMWERVEVEVINKVAGQSLPIGFSAERQLWVSVELYNPQGKLVFTSGDFDKNADLRDEHSHAVLAGHLPYDRHLMNFQNKFTALTYKGTERSVTLSVNRHLQPLNVLRPATGVSISFGRPFSFRIAKASLPPLKSVKKKYPLPLRDGPGRYALRVRLNFRHLPPVLLDHIGTPHLKHLLEVVVIDEYTATIVAE